MANISNTELYSSRSEVVLFSILSKISAITLSIDTLKEIYVKNFLLYCWPSLSIAISGLYQIGDVST